MQNIYPVTSEIIYQYIYREESLQAKDLNIREFLLIIITRITKFFMQNLMNVRLLLSGSANSPQPRLAVSMWISWIEWRAGLSKPKKSHNSFLYRKEIVEIRPSMMDPAFAINVIVNNCVKIRNSLHLPFDWLAKHWKFHIFLDPLASLD